MIVDTNGVTNQIIMGGWFTSIKKVTDNTLIVRSKEQLIVVHKLQPFIILDSPGGWGFTDNLQWIQQEGALLFFENEYNKNSGKYKR